MKIKEVFKLILRNFGFYVSHEINYPLVSPDTIQLNFLARCNLKCKICSIENFTIYDRTHELSYETMEKLIKQAFEMGIKEVLLLGGEPFLRPDIFKLVKQIKKYGLRPIIITNGTILNKTILDKIFDSELNNLHISIDGATEKTFNKIRGQKVLNKIIKNIQIINKEKIKRNCNYPSLSSTCVITNQNLDELLDIVKLTQNLGMGGVNFQPFVPDNSDQRKIDYSKPSWVLPERYGILDRAIDDLINFKLSNRTNFDFICNTISHLKMMKKYFRGTLKKGARKCYTGYNRLQITRNGTIYFCAEGKAKGEVALDNIYKDKLADLWYSRDAKIFRKNIKKCPQVCLQFCSYRTDFDKIMNYLYKFYYFNIKKNKNE